MDDCTHQGEKRQFPVAVLTLRLVNQPNQWQTMKLSYELRSATQGLFYGGSITLPCLPPLSQLNPFVPHIRAICSTESTSSVMMLVLKHHLLKYKCYIVFVSRSMVDMLDWNSLIDERTKISNLLVVPNLQVGRQRETDTSTTA